MVSFHDIIIDIVMDNAGFELFSDLCLSDFLISTGIASLVRLRVKVSQTNNKVMILLSHNGITVVFFDDFSAIPSKYLPKF